MKGLFQFFLFIAVVVSLYWIFLNFGKPSNDRDWSLDQAILPYYEINGTEIKIYNVRNFRYRDVNDYDPFYYTGTYDLEKLRSVDFVLEPFANNPNLAHSFLSFGFNDGRRVAISVEVRKEKDEKFSALRGLFNQYELMYVIADERDVISLRANYRKDKVYVYPGKVSQENLEKLFLDMLNRANQLKDRPEYYNSFLNNCTTNIVAHINHINPGKIKFDIRIFISGKLDQMALELGLIDTDLQLDEARDKYEINSRAKQYIDSPSFSNRIRE